MTNEIPNYVITHVTLNWFPKTSLCSLLRVDAPNLIWILKLRALVEIIIGWLCGLVKLNIGREKLSTMSSKDIHIIL